MARKPIIQDGQYLLDLAEVRERVALLARLMDREGELRLEEAAARAKLQEIRRRLKENRWDQRNAANMVKKEGRKLDEGEEKPDGEVVS